MRVRTGEAPLARPLAIGLLVLAIAAIRSGRLDAWTGPCALRAATGWPCPTCDGTRALAALADGRVLAALAANPLVAAGALAGVCWALGGLTVTLVPSWRRQLEWSAGDGRRLALAAIGLVAANWVWLLR